MALQRYVKDVFYTIKRLHVRCGPGFASRFGRETVSTDIGWADEVDGVGIGISRSLAAVPEKSYSDEMVDTGWIPKLTYLLIVYWQSIPWPRKWRGRPRRALAHLMSLMPEGMASLDALRRSRLQWGISHGMVDTGWILARSTYLLLVFFPKSSLRCGPANSGRHYGTGGIVSAGLSCNQQSMDSLAGFSIPDQLPLLRWRWSRHSLDWRLWNGFLSFQRMRVNFGCV